MIQKIKNWLKATIIGKLIREIKYRRRMRELKKRDPFIY